jgi:tRNA A37 threonylcarbamoyladenosine dehydratase
MASIKYDHDRLYELMFSRNKLVLNEENQRKIKNSSVAVLGLGGVGSPLCELLMRAGFVNVTIVARGVYELGNINGQLAATYISVNARIPKASAMAERMLEVNPFCNINILRSNVKNDGKIKNVLKKENVKIVFNCVDEFLAQVSVAKIAREINAMMIVGGVSD